MVLYPFVSCIRLYPLLFFQKSKVRISALHPKPKRTMRTLILLLLLFGTTAQAMELYLRDSETGMAMEAEVWWLDENGQEETRTVNGQTRINAKTSIVQLWAKAPGYQTMTLERRLPPETRLTLQLDPLVKAADQRYPPLPKGYMGLDLRLLDATTALPVQGGQLVLQQAEPMASSSKSGGLRYLWPLPASKTADEQMRWLEVHAPGYRSQRLAFFPQAGWLKKILYLQPGRGLDVIEPPERLSRFPWKTQQNPPLPKSSLPAEEKALLATVIAPPASITVGFADANCSQTCCSSSACDNSCTFSLETYVKRGLNDEWIPSWNSHSLRAGSIAYRSYGAWHVNNPRTSRYDICSNACCQVNDPDTSTSTNQAAEATPGMMLTYGSTPARSEFSAENNSWNDPNDGLSCTNADLSCGDGFVGSPDTGWPCLADAVAQGRGCFGHGRGLSQWGSQRWTYNSNGNKLFNWIVNHYYNDNGNPAGNRSAYISSPLEIHGLQVNPAQASTGDTLQLQLDISNHAAGAHNHILIGASLYSTATGYLDDTANDTLITLPAATRDNRSRNFDLSTAPVPSGHYDVLVALWLDVDEDGQITSADEPLQTYRLNQAVQVSDNSDRLFADSFEGP